VSYDQKVVDNYNKALTEKLKETKPGPWHNEPNRLEFKHAGLDCLLERNMSGAWCGYVGLKPGHKYYGTNYSDLDGVIDVHGGLTYSNECNGLICHYTPVDDRLWWLGFDTVHCGDMAPLHDMRMLMSGSSDMANGLHYWTIKEIKAETVRLADQLK
jgi:hypothetical protein